jgi:Carboxylesterase family
MANTEWIIATVYSKSCIMRGIVVTDAARRRRSSFQTYCLTDVVLAVVSSTIILSALRPSSSTFAVDAKVVANQLSQRIVTTRYGQLRGIFVTLPVSAGIAPLPPVEAYLGIEYGSVLGGELRFMPPTSPVTRWNGVRSALKFRPVCPQHVPTALTAPTSGGDRTWSTGNTMPHKRVERLRRLKPFLERQHEECLSLNIYVPVTGKSRGRRSIISHGVFINWLMGIDEYSFQLTHFTTTKVSLVRTNILAVLMCH